MASATFHYIEDQTVLAAIQAVLDLAGQNYYPAYSASTQPVNGVNLNNEDLIQFQVPGGSTIRGMAEPSTASSIATSINSMLSVLAPIISAYGLLLPIMGVIRGLIEVICAMMNPFAVIAAVIRLFKKWIPAFISIFPPLAGVVIIIGVIKVILAVTYFVLTVLIPTIQLIIFNIKVLAAAFGPDGNAQQQAAGRKKLQYLITELINQTGILNVLAPLLDVVFLILGLVAGFPCKSGKTKKGKNDLTNFEDTSPDPDSTCCDTNVCPPVLQNPPSGTAILVPTTFGEASPFFSMNLITNNPDIALLQQYVQNFPDQLNNQLDEPVNSATPAGGNGDSSMLSVEITSRRGTTNSITVPIVKITGTDITILNPAARSMLGKVDYVIKPNYELLVMYGIIGLGCHPDVAAAKAEAEAAFPNLDTSVLDRFPELSNLQSDFQNVNNTLSTLFTDLNNQIADVSSKPPPYDDNINAINDLQNNASDVFNGFADNLKGLLTGLLSGSIDPFVSLFDTDKTVVRSDGKDHATLQVTPRDTTGTNLIQNLPAGVSIEVNFETNFGFITNQRIDTATGQVLADFISTSAGIATVRAKINADFVSIQTNGISSPKELTVRFVGDATLPTRRITTKLDKNISGTTDDNFEKGRIDGEE